MQKSTQDAMARKISAANRIWLATAIWAAIIFATSCSFIERRVFIDFVKKFIPAGVPQQLWVNFWSYFGIFVVKAYHVTEFALLCWLLHFTLRSVGLKKPTSTIALSAVLALLYAASDEWHQTFVPGRGGTWVDVMIDSIGISIATILLLRREKKMRKSQQTQPL
jgi:VanZ family protein